MFAWLADAVSSLVQWAFWVGKENGPAVGKRSRRVWGGLVLLGRAQFWVAAALLVGLVLWWTYSA